MIMNEPYFMTNDKWYYYDENEGKFKLTDKAPPEAIESYKEFYKLYVKLAMLIVKNKVLSFKYLVSAINASIDYWTEVFKGVWRKK